MAGRPPKYESPEELEKAVEAYFDECVIKKDIPIQSGLAYSLGFASRQSLYDYAQKEQYSYIIGRAKLRCEDELNQAALKGEANPSIAKLNLATNYGYSEKQMIEHSGNVATQFSIIGIDADTDSQED